MTQIEQSVRFAEVVNGDDVRMIELGERAGFTGEALGERRIAAPLGGQHLEGDESIELRLPGLVDSAHAALAEQAEDFQVREVRRQLGG